MPIIASLSRRRTQTFERTTLFSAYSGVQNGEVYSRLKRRPSSRTRKTRVMARMKIDATIKAYFRQGVKLFYDTGCKIRIGSGSGAISVISSNREIIKSSLRQ